MYCTTFFSFCKPQRFTLSILCDKIFRMARKIYWEVVNHERIKGCLYHRSVRGVPARVLRQIDERDRLYVWEKYVKNELPDAQQ